MSKVHFSQLFKKNHTFFLNYAHKLTKSNVDAKDLVQEASIKAFKNKSQLLEFRKFKSWFTKVIYNTFINQFHKRKRRHHLMSTYGYGSSYFFNKRMASNRGFLNLKLSDINKEISKIDEKYQDTFMLYYRGFSYKEISRAKDIPIGTVKSRINYARQKIKNSLPNSSKQNASI